MTEANEPAMAPPVRPDYPSGLPPMLVKELRQLLRTKGFLVLFLGIHLIMAVVLMLAILAPDIAASGYYTVLNIVFWTTMTVVLLIVTPIRASNALNAEIATRSIDLLLLTRLSARRIILGKWGSLMGTALLFVVSILPYGVLRYFFGAVNLVEDALQLTVMLISSATLTALAIWTSGRATVLRVLALLLLMGFVQTTGIALLSRSAMGAATPTGTAASGLYAAPAMALYLCFCLAFLLAVFLLQAAVRLAPPAENEAPGIRLLPVLAIASAIPAQLLDLAAGAVPFAFLLLILVCAIDVARARVVQPVHWRPWIRHTPTIRLAGYCCLPGWASAALYAGVLLSLLALAGLAPDLRITGTGTGFWSYAWWLALAWQALVFPAVLLAGLPEKSRSLSVAPLYFSLHILLGLLALFASHVPDVFMNLKAGLVTLGNFLPVSSFWLATAALPKQGLGTGQLVGQSLVMAGTVVMFWIQAKPLFLRLHRMAQLEGPEPEPLRIERRR